LLLIFDSLSMLFLILITYGIHAHISAVWFFERIVNRHRSFWSEQAGFFQGYRRNRTRRQCRSTAETTNRTGGYAVARIYSRTTQ